MAYLSATKTFRPRNVGMIRVQTARTEHGVNLSLPPEERRRWPGGRAWVFLSTSPEEEGLGLSEILSEDQARAAVAILTGQGSVMESVHFSDKTTGETAMAVLRTA